MAPCDNAIPCNGLAFIQIQRWGASLDKCHNSSNQWHFAFFDVCINDWCGMEKCFFGRFVHYSSDQCGISRMDCRKEECAEYVFLVLDHDLLYSICDKTELETLFVDAVFLYLRANVQTDAGDFTIHIAFN